MLDSLVSYICAAFVFLAIAVIPGLLTLFNILAVFPKLRARPFFAKRLNACGIIAMIWGFILLFAFLEICGNRRWDLPIILGGDISDYHEPISSEYLLSFTLPLLLSAVSAVILLRVRKRKPPLVSAVLIALTYIGNIQLPILSVQLFKPHKLLYFIPPAVYALNFLLVTVRAIRAEIADQLQYLSHNNSEGAGRIDRLLYRMLDRSTKWVTLSFILLLPIIGIITVLLILFGQEPSGMVKAFTETADWTFSQRIPPPPEYYMGHYLCTAAAGGHRKIVRPTRYGIRRGERIIVNRQLCIANAFEDLIQERTPRLHKRIRRFYDTHGYPIATKMTTKTRADIVYILMKPLEWIFLLVLYTFDADPESRIAVQYTEK